VRIGKGAMVGAGAVVTKERAGGCDGRRESRASRLVLPSLSIVVPAFDEAVEFEATVAEAFRGRRRGRARARGHRVQRRLARRHRRAARDGTPRASCGCACSSAPRISRDRGVDACALTRVRAHGVGVLDVGGRIASGRCTRWFAMAHAAESGARLRDAGVARTSARIYTPYRRVVSWGYERIVRALGAPRRRPGLDQARRAASCCTPRSPRRGVFAEGERVIRAARAGARVVEVPVEFQRRDAGRATGARASVVARALVDACAGCELARRRLAEARVARA